MASERAGVKEFMESTIGRVDITAHRAGRLSPIGTHRQPQRGRTTHCTLTVPLDERGDEPTSAGSMGSMAFSDGGLAARRRRIP